MTFIEHSHVDIEVHELGPDLFVLLACRQLSSLRTVTSGVKCLVEHHIY
jgi:hypothetical protein